MILLWVGFLQTKSLQKRVLSTLQQLIEDVEVSLTMVLMGHTGFL